MLMQDRRFIRFMSFKLQVLYCGPWTSTITMQFASFSFL